MDERFEFGIPAEYNPLAGEGEMDEALSERERAGMGYPGC